MGLKMKLSKTVMAGMMVLSVFSASFPVRAAESFGGADSGQNTVPVTVEFSEDDDRFSAKAMIPTSISIKGKSGTYHVMAYYEKSDIGKLNANLSITPSGTFTLTKDGGTGTATAKVTQTKTTFTPDDVRNGTDGTITVTNGSGTSEHREVKEATAEGKITVDGITYGTWTGNMVFTIS